MGWQYSLDILLSQYQSVVPCPVLTVASWLAYRFLRRQVRWSGIPLSWTISTVGCDTHKVFSVVNEAEVDAFLEFSCFFYDPADVGNLISGSSAFSQSSFYICKFSVHMLLKSSLENFEHYFASMWDECNCLVVWTFFGIAFLWDWTENWPFPVLWPLLSFPNLLAYWVQQFNSTLTLLVFRSFLYTIALWSYNFGMPVGRVEHRVLLFCHLDHTHPNYLVLYSKYFRAFLAICAIRLHLRLTVAGTRLSGNSVSWYQNK